MNPFSRHLSRSSRRSSQGARNVPALLLGLSILVCLALPPSRSEASGLNLTVNTLADEDDGIGVGSISLRDAINAANGLPGPHFISFWARSR